MTSPNPATPTTRQPDPSSRRLSPQLYLMGAAVATTANLVLWAVGYHHTIATGMLVGAASAGVICWQVRRSEERVTDRIESFASDMWWHGYATALEDGAAGGHSRTVVPFRSARGDRSGDSGHALNGSELL